MPSSFICVIFSVVSSTFAVPQTGSSAGVVGVRICTPSGSVSVMPTSGKVYVVSAAETGRQNAAAITRTVSRTAVKRPMVFLLVFMFCRSFLRTGASSGRIQKCYRHCTTLLQKFILLFPDFFHLFTNWTKKRNLTPGPAGGTMGTQTTRPQAKKARLGACAGRLQRRNAR